MSTSRMRSVLALVTLLVFLGSVVVATTAAEKPQVPKIPGVTVADDHPNGCVDCHKKVSPERDYSLETEIANMVKAGTHPKVPERMMKDLPKGCVSCHKPDGKHPFGDVLHVAHLTGGADNHFITQYQGQCTQCHSFDAKTGKMAVKGLQ